MFSLRSHSISVTSRFGTRRCCLRMSTFLHQNNSLILYKTIQSTQFIPNLLDLAERHWKLLVLSPIHFFTPGWVLCLLWLLITGGRLPGSRTLTCVWMYNVPKCRVSLVSAWCSPDCVTLSQMSPVSPALTWNNKSVIFRTGWYGNQIGR